MDIPDTADNRVSKRGFASMSRERQLEIARKGGAAVPGEKRAFSTNKELAQEAGRKGGAVSIRRRQGDA
ncbi:general stress protein [Brevundimonas sp. TWP2-3-4b1]|uniref:general stress protein n=1 Tax=Brevundimonas sp. TWP2-3-4b1 TaxID=2804580 RepID=UPI003CF4325A